MSTGDQNRRSSHKVPKLQHVRSESIAAVGYERHSNLLFIRFTDGRTYAFERVPASLFHRLMASDSKGRFFNDEIREAGFAVNEITDRGT